MTAPLPATIPIRPPGRPSRLTADARARLLAATRRGATRSAAAQYAGVCAATLYTWLRRGREQERGQYRELLEALRAADSEAELALLSRIHAASAAGEWRAAAWVLERRFPRRWGARERLTLAGDAEQPVTFFTLDIPRPTPRLLTQIGEHDDDA